ncbi:MAG TPA: hypothetical protein PKA37_02515 [Planctomycetota bacterium]|jgi:peptidoglycan hydrolase CwlO-like protein|nr:hypothetical protein [Planctomycetota bacterium]
MRSLLLLTLVSLTFVACGDSHESLMNDSFDQMEKLADVLEKVDANTKPEDLKAKVQPIADELKDIKKRMEAMGEPSKELQEKLEKSLKERGEKAMSRMMAASMKAASVKGIDEIMASVMQGL